MGVVRIGRKPGRWRLSAICDCAGNVRSQAECVSRVCRPGADGSHSWMESYASAIRVGGDAVGVLGSATRWRARKWLAGESTLIQTDVDRIAGGASFA
jgi:hypothetical protein